MGLQAALEQYGLEGLEDQIMAITGRRDIGSSQKAELIVALGKEKLKPSTARFLSRAKRSQGGRILEYRILDKVPLVKGLFYDVIRKEASRVSYELLSRVNMPNAESVLNQYPHELSGGMRQRVMIAMAIAAKPKLLIADEPTSALDVTVQAQILDLLRDLKSSLNTSVLFISHDLGVISEICDRVGVMYAGNIVEIAPLEELFASPQHPYSQGLLAAIPKYGGKTETLETIKGSVPDLIDPPKGCRFGPRCPRAFDKCKEGPPWIKVGDGHYVLCWLYGNSEKHVHQ
jgi:oligopeptide/dipeptide ABC transporter ATP-binding protein